eukprot:s154_g6.t1
MCFLIVMALSILGDLSLILCTASHVCSVPRVGERLSQHSLQLRRAVPQLDPNTYLQVRAAVLHLGWQGFYG